MPDMKDGEPAVANDEELSPECDCGYVCQGLTPEERLRDGQHHAREVHGIEVTPEQIASGTAHSPVSPGTAELRSSP